MSGRKTTSPAGSPSVTQSNFDLEFMNNANQTAQKFLQQSAAMYHNSILSGWESLYQRKRQKLFLALRPYHVSGHGLELGSADGIMTEKLLPDFETLTVVDGSQIFLDQIRTRITSPKLRLVHGLFETFQPEQKYSTIFMTHIIEHLEDPVGVLKKARGWLAPGGRILIAVPNAKSLHRYIGVKLGMLERIDAFNEQDVALGHKRVYAPEMLRAHVGEAGLNIIKFGGLMVKPLSNRQIEKQWSEDLIEAFFALSEDMPELCSEIYVVTTA